MNRTLRHPPVGGFWNDTMRLSHATWIVDYLTELLLHPAELAVRPAEWMPWNMRDVTAVAA
jgi:hypothetical protein